MPAFNFDTATIREIDERTSQEAALHLSPTSKAGRAITRGPAIRQVSPAGPVAPAKPPAKK